MERKNKEKFADSPHKKGKMSEAAGRGGDGARIVILL